jgi:hypothetical protein
MEGVRNVKFKKWVVELLKSYSYLSPFVRVNCSSVFKIHRITETHRSVVAVIPVP